MRIQLWWRLFQRCGSNSSTRLTLWVGTFFLVLVCT
jgi:hypothetical protein